MDRDLNPAMHETSAELVSPISKYVYCIIRVGDIRNFGNIGVDHGSLVYTIPYGELAAVVSDCSGKPYLPSRENVLTHERVNQRVMKDFTVIPMSFGTVFASDLEVRGLLQSTYQSFSDVLDRMQDKVEFGVRVTWNRDEVVAGIENSNDEIKRLKDEINNNSSSSTYFARTQLNRLVEAGLEEVHNRYIDIIHDTLKKASVASRSHPVGGNRTILNFAFLVDRKHEALFSEAIIELTRKFIDVLQIDCSGPWPPYNFVSIKPKLEKAN